MQIIGWIFIIGSFFGGIYSLESLPDRTMMLLLGEILTSGNTMSEEEIRAVEYVERRRFFGHLGFMSSVILFIIGLVILL